ncbi:MAG TPA: hypothetical protein VIU34_06475, partial [Steroidobacter sp.]
MPKERAVDDAVLEQLPRSLRRQSMFERFHLYKPEIFQNRSRDPTFDPAYFPQNSGVVQLSCYWIERRHLYVFGDSGELGLCASEGPDGAVLFPIHPASVAHYR